MTSVADARVKARSEADLLDPPSGPYCPLNGHAFTCPCRECSEFWDTSAGTMVHQYWLDRAYLVGDR